LAFDHLTRDLELAGMGTMPSLVAQWFAFFGLGWLEFDALCVGSADQFDASRFPKLAVLGRTMA
jgi:hypothetical protein